MKALLLAAVAATVFLVTQSLSLPPPLYISCDPKTEEEDPKCPEGQICRFTRCGYECGDPNVHPDYSCDDDDKIQCLNDPCYWERQNGCEAYPEAECRNNFCYGCFADWYVGDELVDCKKNAD